jgi:hypothetical protein
MNRLFPLLFSCLVLSCYPTIRPSVITPQGDEAIIHLNNGSEHNGELIAVRDSGVYLIIQNKMTSIHFNDIKQIEIPGYRVTAEQSVPAAIPSLLLQMIILLAASGEDEQMWVMISGISMAVTITLYATAGGELKISAPFSKNRIEELRLYCRYPQELDNEIWNAILIKHR